MSKTQETTNTARHGRTGQDRSAKHRSGRTARPQRRTPDRRLPGALRASREEARIAAIPGILLVGMTLIEWVAVMIWPEPMEDYQYTFYPLLGHMVMAAVVLEGLLFLLARRRLRAQRHHLAASSRSEGSASPKKDRRAGGRVSRKERSNRRGAGRWHVSYDQKTAPQRRLGRWLGPLRTARPETIFFALFLGCILVSTVVHGVTRDALLGRPYRNQGIIADAINILILFGVSRQIAGDEYRNRWYQRIVMVWLLTADGIAGSVIVHRWIHPVAAYTGKKDLSAIFFNGNHYGYFLVMVILLAAGWYIRSSSRVIRGLMMVTFLLNDVVLLWNNSFGGILAVFLSLIALNVWTWKRVPEARRRAVTVLALYIVLPLAGGAALAHQVEDWTQISRDVKAILEGGADASSAGTNRWGQWLTAVSYIKEHPWLGFGCEGASVRMLKEIGVGNPHNEILTYAIYFGIPAAACYVLGVLSVFVRFVQTAAYRQPVAMAAGAAALGYFISSMFGVAMFYTTPFFFLLLGTMAAQEEVVGDPSR